MPELAYVNGVFCPIDKAVVSIDDRGFQFGDGVYEVIFAYNRRLFLFDQHMERLRRSLATIHIDFDTEPLEAIVEEGVRRFELSDVMVYLQVTRGKAPRAHAIPAEITPTVVMTFRPIPELSRAFRDRGAKLMTTRETRWANCSVKAITLLPNVLAKNEALRSGFDDAVFIADDGEVRECTSANIFIVNGQRITSPPRTESVLHGVTQSFLAQCAASLGIACEEAIFDVEALCAADEVFMSSTAVEVLAVTSIDGKPVGFGEVGPQTKRLFDEFRVRSRG